MPPKPTRLSKDSVKTKPATAAAGSAKDSHNTSDVFTNSVNSEDMTSPPAPVKRNSQMVQRNKNPNPASGMSSSLITNSPSKAIAAVPALSPNATFSQKVEHTFNSLAIQEAGSHLILPINSVENALLNLELNPSSSRIETALKNDGYSQRGLILNDFRRLAQQFQETMANLHAMIENFKTLDTDHDDKISRDQFIEFNKTLPPRDRITGRSLEEVMSTLDPINCGFIYLRSFLKTLFVDFSDEEILNAMVEHGFDPEREAKETAERRRLAAEKARQNFERDYDELMGNERMNRNEIQADFRSFEKDFEIQIVESRETAMAEERQRVEKEKEEKGAADEALDDIAKTRSLEEEAAEAERARLEAEKKAEEEKKKQQAAEEEAAKKKKEEEERKQKAAEEEAARKKKAEEEAARKKKEEEDAKKAAAAAAAPPAGAPPAAAAAKPPAPPAAKKDGGGCCIVM